MRADNSRHIVAAARQRADETRSRALTALRRMRAAGQRITFDTVARQAGVSRSWLYSQDDLRAEIQQTRQPRPASPPQHQRASDTSLLRRLEAAADRIQRLEAENRDLRTGLARALGDRRAGEVVHGPANRDTPNNNSPDLIRSR